MTAKNTIKAISKTELARDYAGALRKAFNAMLNAFDKKISEGKLTQDDLAKLLNVNKGLISRRLNGTKNLTLRTLSAMASALGCYLVVSFEPYESRTPHNSQWHDNFRQSTTESSSAVKMEFSSQIAAIQ